MLASGLSAADPAGPAHAAADEVGTLGSSARASLGGYPVWAHFSNPRTGRDYTIIDELKRLINAAPSGSVIRGTIFSISIDSVASTLVNAKNRGVNVQVVLDGKVANSSDPSIPLIRQLTHKFCTNSNGGGGCISTSADGDMHVKSFTFTSTRDPNGTARSNVSWFSSSNLTYSSGPDAFNNAVTVYGDAALMNGLNTNFADMWARRHYTDNDYYDAASGRGRYIASAGDVYASPEAVGQTDTIATRINDITPDSNCQMRIGMPSVTSGRPVVLNQILRYRSGGCRVWMVVGGTAEEGIRMNETVYHTLLNAGVNIRRMAKVHDKYFISYGKYGEGLYRFRVHTGSQNWTQDALNENDEIFVKMGPEASDSNPLYDAYIAHFNSAYNYGTTCTVSNFPCK